MCRALSCPIVSGTRYQTVDNKSLFLCPGHAKESPKVMKFNGEPVTIAMFEEMEARELAEDSSL